MLLRARERTLGLVAAFVALVLVVTVLVHGPAQTVRAQGGTGTIALVDTYPGLPLTSEAPSRLLHVRPVFPVPGGDAQYQTVLSERENDGPWVRMAALGDAWGYWPLRGLLSFDERS